MQQSHQDMVASLTSFSATSSTFTFLFKVLFTVPSWYVLAIGLEPISRPLSLSLSLSPPLSLSLRLALALSRSLSLAPSLALSPALSVALSHVQQAARLHGETLRPALRRRMRPGAPVSHGAAHRHEGGVFGAGAPMHAAALAAAISAWPRSFSSARISKTATKSPSLNGFALRFKREARSGARTRPRLSLIHI